MDQETLLKASFLHKEIQEMDQHIEAINEQLIELTQLRDNLNFLAKSDEKSLISSLGRGIHLKTVLEEKKLFVEVGSGVVVRKTPEQTKEKVEEQLRTLKEAGLQILSQKELYNNHLRQLIEEIEKAK